jgi:YVTN family beta-propeller protein
MGLSISKDGSTLYVADGYNFLKVIDTKSHKLLTQVVVGSHPISIGSFLQPTIAVKARSPVPVPSVPIPAACGSASLLLTQPNAEHLCGNPELPFIYAHNANFHHYEDITDVCSKGQSANCTADTVFAILLRTPAAIAPVVSTVTASDIRSCQVLQLQGSCLEYDNKIQIVIDGTQRSVTNYTLPKHIFYPGQITRQIVEIDGRVKIKTIGLGVGCNQFFNKEAGTCKIWPDADQSLRIAVWKSLGLGGPPSIGIPDAACRLVTTIGGAVCNLF